MKFVNTNSEAHKFKYKANGNRWSLKKIKHIAPLQRGHDLPNKKLIEGKYPVVYSNGIGNYHSEYIAKGPGVITGRSGTLGKVTFVKENYWPHNTSLWVTSFKKNYPLYIYYLYIFIKLEKFGSGSGVPTLNRNDVHDYEITIPESIKEQQAIAEALSNVDDLIRSLDALIEKKQAIKKGTMQQLLTGKKRLPGFSGDWEVKRLGAVLDYEQPTKYLVSSTDYNDNNEIPVLTAGKTFILGYTHEQHNVFDNVPVIIFDDFTTATKYVDFPFKVKSSAMKILQPKNEKINIRFIYEIMQGIDYPMGIGDHKRHWIANYQLINIAVPREEEQDMIATVLSNFENEIQALQKKRDKYKQIKQGMMQELLTGKTRLI